ncbi:peroxisomal assembly protein [Phytophthora boehmeriae]|uniref:Peroxisomal assembly protein n=1 Tax=Phytophthora boehmeriae TaxID=109152 RepID=A0A8T1X167_9STRA|nr:peroxisomal assembly protein [Phytophthora boehmeriae]
MTKFASSIGILTCTLAICSAGATSSDQTWLSQFRSKINVMPAPTDGCSVCFHEQINFTGSKFCIGKRNKTSTSSNPIQTPGTIASIKFSKGCALVVNARVTDPPYGEHVDVISTDVVNTGYQNVVQEVYVEEPGRACFLGVPESANGYGRCYTENVFAVESQYRNVFNELMLFKTRTTNFDVIAYEMNNFNGANPSAMSYRFTGYSKALETDKDDGNTGMKQTMQGKVRSIAFVTATG